VSFICFDKLSAKRHSFRIKLDTHLSFPLASSPQTAHLIKCQSPLHALATYTHPHTHTHIHSDTKCDVAMPKCAVANHLCVFKSRHINHTQRVACNEAKSAYRLFTLTNNSNFQLCRTTISALLTDLK